MWDYYELTSMATSALDNFASTNDMWCVVMCCSFIWGRQFFSCFFFSFWWLLRSCLVVALLSSEFELNAAVRITSQFAGSCMVVPCAVGGTFWSAHNHKPLVAMGGLVAADPLFTQ
jgi:hypothetical protein